MKTAARNAVIVGPTLALVGVGLALLARSARPFEAHRSALDAVPGGAQVVVVFDALALRGTKMGDDLRGRWRDELGGELLEACGFDLLEGAHEVAVVSPASASDGGWAVVVAGDVATKRVVGCASRRLDARGARALTTREGEFWVVSDAATATGWVVAARDGGPWVAGSMGYVRQMMASAEGRTASAVGDPRHAALRAGASVAKPSVVVTGLLTADRREWLRGIFGDAATAAVGVGAALGVGDPVDVRVVLGCARPGSCAALASSIERHAPADAAAPGPAPVRGLRAVVASDFVVALSFDASYPAVAALAAQLWP